MMNKMMKGFLLTAMVLLAVGCKHAVQNHYLSFGYSSPMIFLGTDFWTKELPVYPFLEELVKLGKYKNLQLTLTDDFDVIVKELETFRNR